MAKTILSHESGYGWLYLAQALEACRGMVDLELTSPSSPILSTTSGYVNANRRG